MILGPFEPQTAGNRSKDKLGFPMHLLLRIEAIGFPTFGLLPPPLEAPINWALEYRTLILFGDLLLKGSPY